MTVEWILIACGIALYLVASALAAVRLMRPSGEGDRGAATVAALGVAVFAIVLLMHAWRTGRVPVFGRFESITCYAVAVTVAFLAQTFQRRAHGMSVVVLPYAAVLLIIAAPAAGRDFTMNVTFGKTWLGLHVLATFSGYALFTLSGMYAMAYLLQDHNLKRKHFGVTFERLPSLSVLDHQMHRLTGVALLMLTAGIVFGVRLVDLSGGGAEWLSDPKIAATFATWVVYALLLHVRGNIGRHGRKIAIATAIALVFVLFTFFGVHALTESRHSFALPIIPGG